MNKKLIILCAISCFSIALQHASAQDKSKSWPPKKFPHDPKNCFHLLSNSYQCKWIFWGIKNTIEGTVIAYDTVSTAAKGPATASVSIVKTGKDTVRILFLNGAKIKTGDHVIVSQGKEPELDVLVPFDRDFFLSEENKGNKPQCRINEYDSRIFKTNWGKITDKPQPATTKSAGQNHPAKKK